MTVVLLTVGGLHSSLFFQLVLLVGSVVGQSVTNVSNGQQLADAIAAWAVSGQDATLLLAAPLISMHNVTFTKPVPNGREPYSSGQLTIAAAPDVRFTVIDGAMRGGLVPPMKGATMLLRSVGILNSCESSQPSRNSSDGGLFFFSLLYISTFVEDTTFYVWPSEVARVVYVNTMLRTSVTDLQQLAVPLLQDPVGFNKLGWMTPSAVYVNILSATYMAGTGVTIRSYDDPTDSVLHTIRQQQLVMQPQYCSGTLFPSAIAQELVDPLLPLVYVTSSADMSRALDAVRAIIKRQGLPWKPAPIIMLNETVPLDTSIAGTTPLDYPVMFTGPAAVDWQYPATGTLDLRGVQGSLKLGPAGKVYMQHLTLTNLAQLPRPSTPSLKSAFPIAAITPATTTTTSTTAVPGNSTTAVRGSAQTYIWMHNVTMVLPRDDYLALLSIAVADSLISIDSSLEPPVKQLAASLQPEIVMLTRGQVSSDMQQLMMTSFAAWGMNATAITLVPTEPVRLSSPTAHKSQGTCGTWACAQLIGVVVGVGLVVGMLVVALLCGRRLYKRIGGQRAGCAEVRQKALVLTMVLKHDQAVVVTDSGQSGCEPGRRRLGTAPHVTTVPHVHTLSSRLSAMIEDRHSRHSPRPLGLSSPSAGACAGACAGQLADQSGSLFRSMEQELEEIRRRAAMLNNEADQVTIDYMLGRGSYGCVFKGTWRGLPVALKTVVFEDPPGARDARDGPTRDTRAIMEAAIACSVGHPNIVACYTYDIKPIMAMDNQGALQVSHDLQGGEGSAATVCCLYKLFLVQELCSASLAMVITERMLVLDDGSGIDWGSCISLMLDVARGLEYLHSNGIIHGDLKLENVLLKLNYSTDAQVQAKLSDFGLSTHLPANSTHVSGFQCGTPFYVAPEVVTHAKASPASDVYSFGIIMWECAASSSVAVKGPGGDPDWNPAFPHFPLGRVPPEPYVDLVLRCISNSASHRPTAVQVMQQLEQLSRDIPPSLVVC